MHFIEYVLTFIILFAFFNFYILIYHIYVNGVAALLIYFLTAFLNFFLILAIIRQIEIENSFSFPQI